jgi:hypothetical protein
MIRPAAAVLLLLAAAAAPGAEPGRPVQYAQVTVREQVLIRVPVRVRPLPAPAAVQWKESKGPKCVAARGIAGAALSGRNSVDLILRDSKRVRARLDSNCPELDYYYGFYIMPHRDGMICEDRDVIRSRVGGQCEIDDFKALEAVARR